MTMMMMCTCSVVNCADTILSSKSKWLPSPCLLLNFVMLSRQACVLAHKTKTWPARATRSYKRRAIIQSRVNETIESVTHSVTQTSFLMPCSNEAYTHTIAFVKKARTDFQFSLLEVLFLIITRQGETNQNYLWVRPSLRTSTVTAQNENEFKYELFLARY